MTWLYGYDNKNELTSAKEYSADPALGGSPTLLIDGEYKYDAWDNRIEKDVTQSGTTTTTRYAQDGWDPGLADTTGNSRFNVLADLSGSNQVQSRYLRGEVVDQIFARIDVSGGTETPYWYLQDWHNSTRNLLDSTGHLARTVAYDAFGNITSETGTAPLGSYDWTGRQTDIETGLQYNRDRYYDPTTSRWISEDPLGFDAGDNNLYRYVRNQNTVARDPAGLVLWSDNEATAKATQATLAAKGDDGPGIGTVLKETSLGCLIVPSDPNLAQKK